MKNKPNKKKIVDKPSKTMLIDQIRSVIAKSILLATVVIYIRNEQDKLFFYISSLCI